MVAALTSMITARPRSLGKDFARAKKLSSRPSAHCTRLAALSFQNLVSNCWTIPRGHQVHVNRQNPKPVRTTTALAETQNKPLSDCPIVRAFLTGLAIGSPLKFFLG